MRNNFFSDKDFFLKFVAEGCVFAFEITRTIHSNRESSEQFLKQNTLKKTLGFRTLKEKLENQVCM